MSRVIDWKGWIPVWVAVLTAVVLGALAFAGKADSGTVEHVQTQVNDLRIDAARKAVADGWRDAAVYEIARKVGAAVPPPPGP